MEAGSHGLTKLALYSWETEKKLKQMEKEGKLAEVKRIDLALKIFHAKLLVTRAREFQEENYSADNRERYVQSRLDNWLIKRP
ncbi:unnamed protein product [Blepharisma stoltei]|uniref:Uncharacterized protein n=1 Tax=Blepharisma stoltei TaxID=1481888 RepID=A0AAU9JYB3_9CILI|nr:unnamed protein product [Blepharisma stoltei]